MSLYLKSQLEVKITKLPKSEIEIFFQLTPQELKEYLNEAIFNLGQKVEIKGFRKGKTPKEILKQNLPDNVINEELTNTAVQKSYVKAVMSNNLHIIGNPKIEVVKFVPEQELEFKAKTAVFPEIEIADYKSIAKEELKNKKEIIVQESEIKDALNWLQNSRAKYTTSNESAKTGDLVEIDFSTMKDNVSVEGGSAKKHRFVLGEGKFMPGFEEQITGMKTGEEKEFSLTAPDDYFKKELRNQTLDFKVILNQTHDRELPEINDDFAKNIGNFQNLEALKTNIKEGISEEKKKGEKEKFKMAILEKTAEKSKMELPDILVKMEIEDMIEELKEKTKSLGLEFDSYLQQLKTTEEKLKEQLRPQAEKRIKQSLVLRKISESEDIQVPKEEIEEKAQQILNQVSTGGEKADKEATLQQAESILKSERVFQVLENDTDV